MKNIIIEKLCKDELKEAISIYDANHNITTNYKKLYEQYDKIYNNPDYHNIVAKLDGKIVGLATIVINYDIVGEINPFITVWNLHVHKNYRRKKIGTEMLNYIYKYALEKNCEFISLIAETGNIVGQKFYESQGYMREVGYVISVKNQK